MTTSFCENSNEMMDDLQVNWAYLLPVEQWTTSSADKGILLLKYYWYMYSRTPYISYSIE